MSKREMRTILSRNGFSKHDPACEEWKHPALGVVVWIGSNWRVPSCEVSMLGTHASGFSVLCSVDEALAFLRAAFPGESDT